MTDLVEEAARLQSFVEGNGWDFHFIGGIVVQIWGRPRLTTDLDITVFTNLIDESSYIQAFLKQYRGKFSDAGAFALTARLLPIETEEKIGIDVTLGGLADTNPQLARATYQPFTDEISLKVCSAEDLVILKTAAWRSQDIFDIEGVLIKQSDLDWHYIEHQLTQIDEYNIDSEFRMKVEGLFALKEKYYRK